MENGLIALLPLEELRRLREQFADVPDMVEVLDIGIQGKEANLEQTRLKSDFEARLAKMFKSLPHPEGITNIFAHFGQVEVGDESIPLTEVLLPNGDKAMKRIVQAWIPEVNKVMTYSSKGGHKVTTRRMRAIEVLKVDTENGTLIPVGNFRTAKEACEYLKLTVKQGGETATRILKNEGYWYKDYAGSVFTVSES